MTLAVKISLLFSGLFLLAGMFLGIWKYRQMLERETHQANAYVDIAHRASLLYSFATLVIAKLIEFSPFAKSTQILLVGVLIFYFAVTISLYVSLGMRGRETTQFAERKFITTWGMYGLIAAEIGSLALILGGFVYTQFIT